MSLHIVSVLLCCIRKADCHLNWFYYPQFKDNLFLEPFEAPPGTIIRDHTVLTSLQISKEFDVSFNFIIYHYPKPLLEKRHILRLTNSDDDTGKHGDRILLIMLKPDMKIYVSSSIGNDFDNIVNADPTMEFNEVVNVTVRQIKDGSGYKRQVFINGSKEVETANPMPQPTFENVTLFVSDRHERPVFGNVTDFRLETGIFTQLLHLHPHLSHNFQTEIS